VCAMFKGWYQYTTGSTQPEGWGFWRHPEAGLSGLGLHGLSDALRKVLFCSEETDLAAGFLRALRAYTST
jgi:hypothetical protein